MQGEDDIESEYRSVGASSRHKSLAAPGWVFKMQLVASVHGKPAGMYEHKSLVEMQGDDNIESEYRSGEPQISCCSCFSFRDVSGGNCGGLNAYTENQQNSLFWTRGSPIQNLELLVIRAGQCRNYVSFELILVPFFSQCSFSMSIVFINEIVHLNYIFLLSAHNMIVFSFVFVFLSTFCEPIKRRY